MVVMMIMTMRREVMGDVHPAASALGDGLAVDRGDGRRGRGDVRDLVRG